MTDIHAKLQEEKILRSIRAKRRFRAAVRHVIHNLSWLQDDDEEEIIDPSNVKQTVTRLARKKKTKGKGLSIREKAVLRKNVEYRTDEEKKLLNKYIGGLKCFRRYPENVQLELVGVTYFEYFGQGRVLVKQDHEAHALYFLLSGEVVVSKRQWDEIANEEVEVELNKIFAGNMFGEVSLLHNVPRTATVATIAPCELLVLKKHDFDRVLKASLMQRWDDIREAMTKFVYFDQWDSVAIRECCILSKIKTYVPNQVVFGDRKTKKGRQVNTYFLIEGRCAIIEHLFIEETVKRGIKFYKLYDPPEPVITEIPQSYADKFKKECDEKFSRQQSFEEKLELPEEKVTESAIPITRESLDEKNNEASGSKHTDINKEKSDETVENQTESENIEDREPRYSNKSFTGRKSARISDEVMPPQGERRRTERLSIMSYKNLLKKELHTDESMMQGLRSKLPPNVKLRFMQICTLGPRATFLEGPLMKNRRVIALTPVRILLIPAYWLNQHNKGNVWTRVEKFLYNRIPSRQAVFKAYISDKKWQEYRRKLRDDLLSKRKFYNNTTIHDVPYSIRVVSNYE